MVIYAEAECETCHLIRPKNEMREVQVRRLVGEFTGSARNSNQSNRRSSSFNKSGARFGSGSTSSSGRKSHSRQYRRVERVWVCHGCKDPKPDGAWSTSHYVALALAVLGLLYWAYGRGDAPKAAAGPSRAAETAPAPMADPAQPKSGFDENPADISETRSSEADQAAETARRGMSLDDANAGAPSESPDAVSDQAALQAQLEHTAELRRQGEEEAARIEREAAEQQQQYLEQSRRR